MFKVICIAKPNQLKGRTTGELYSPDIIPVCEIGTEYTVVRILKSKFTGRDCYELAEIPKWRGAVLLHDARLFATLNGPDEVNLMEQRLEKEVARLDAEYEDIGKMLPGIGTEAEASSDRIWGKVKNLLQW